MQKKMLKTVILGVALLLAACEGVPGTIDGQKMLAGLEGPKVPTMQDSLMEGAANAEKAGDFKRAIQRYQQVLEKHPENKDAILAMAACYRRAGNNDQALALYDGLLNADANMIA